MNLKRKITYGKAKLFPRSVPLELILKALIFFNSLIYHDDIPNLEVKKKTRGDPLYFNISKNLSLKHRAPSVP